MYVDASAPAISSVPGSFPWALHNRLGVEQRVNLSATAPGAVGVTFEGVDGDPPVVVLPARGDRTINVRLERAGPGANGIIHLNYETNLGGHGTTMVEVNDATTKTPARSPGLGPGLVVAVIALLGRRLR